MRNPKLGNDLKDRAKARSENRKFRIGNGNYITQTNGNQQIFFGRKTGNFKFQEMFFPFLSLFSKKLLK